MESGWLAYAQVLAGRKHYQQASELASRFGVAPELPPAVDQKPLAELRRNLLINTNDYVTGLALYQATMTANNPADALAVLRELTLQTDCPRYFWYLRARLEMQQAAWEAAWHAWERYLANL